MGRVHGKYFTNKYERKRMFRDIRQEQEYHGTSVEWYVYQGAQLDDAYDEGQRRWTGPVSVPVVSAVPVQGANVSNDAGRFVTDRIVLRISYKQLADAHVGPEISNDFEDWYADRFVYRDHVYGIEALRVDGHFDPDSLDMMVSVTAGQLRPDELYDDIDFTAFATGP